MSKYPQMDVYKLAEIFRALSNPNRLRIYLFLAQCCTASTCASVGDLGKELGVVPSTVSHHIRELVHAGLINCTRQGQHVLCCIDSRTFSAVLEFFGESTPQTNSEDVADRADNAG